MLSVSTGTSAYQYQQMFSKLDKDGSGTVSQDEFSTGRPKDVTEAQSATLFATLNSSGTGAMTYEEYVAGSEDTQSTSDKWSGEMMAMMLDIMQQSQGTEPPAPPSSADMFADIDADGDGSVTQAEFVAARPDDVSEEEATAFFASLDAEGTGSLTEEQFSAGMEAQGPGGPPRGMMPPPEDGTTTESADASTESTVDTTEAIQDILDQLLSAIQAYRENSAQVESETQTDLLLAA